MLIKFLKIPKHPLHIVLLTKYSTVATQKSSIPHHYDINKESESYTEIFLRDMTVIPDFISDQEENSLLEEIKTHFVRKRYEFDHWDNAIVGFRECERPQWNPENEKIIDRIRKTAFASNSPLIQQVHILDLSENGYIKPHIDSIKFCGNTISGVSLLSDSVMRLVLESNKSIKLDVFLARRSLYIMRDDVRYLFTHEILKKEESVFKGVEFNRGRRISVICRNEVS